jgi:cytochrome c oxidase assembly protein subunit 15
MGLIATYLRSGRGLPRYAACVLGFMVLVILQGAVVRFSGSGAGCGNHWPLCNGDFIPHHPRVATIIEFMHRSLTGICTTLVIVLIAWTFIARPRCSLARRAVVWTGILLVTEALLGALLVKGGYVEQNASTARVIVQGIHFTNTMLLLAALTLTWWWLRPRSGPQVFGKHTAGKHTATAWLALLAALITGATGSVAALADTLFPAKSFSAAIAQDFAASSPLLLRMRWLHPAASCLAIAATIFLAYRLRSKASRYAVLLVFIQCALGTADVLLLAPYWLQVLHLLVADLYWIALIASCSWLFGAAPVTADGSAQSVSLPRDVLHSVSR